MAKGIQQEFKKSLFDLEPTAILEFYALYYDYQKNSKAVLFFHNSNNNKIFEPIVYNTQEYLPISIESNGFGSLGDQRLPRPTIKFGNFGMYFSSLLRKYENLSNAKIIRTRTFAKFLDDENFPNGENPFGTANANAKLSDEKFFVERLVSESKLFVELELTSSLELENVNIPKRTINARYCPFSYRGQGCRYGHLSQITGDGFNRPVANLENNLYVIQSGEDYQLNPEIFGSINKTGEEVHSLEGGNGVLIDKGSWGSDSQSYGVGDYVYVKSDKVENAEKLTNNIYEGQYSFYVCKQNHVSEDEKRPDLRSDLWIEDVCSKTLGACRLRFDNAEYADGINNTQEIRFGGFPSTEEFSY